MINLVIKGDIKSAAVAADKRGVRIVSLCKTYGRGVADEVHAAVPDDQLGRVVRWFCEDGVVASPCPAGTLLFYSDDNGARGRGAA